MKGTKFSCGRLRPLALTMPAVTVLSKPNGEPIATTHSPTLSRFGSPIRTAGNPVASILISARSVRLSAPIARALPAGTRRTRDEAPEEIVERIVFLEIRNLRRSTALANLSGTDVDDGGAL